MRKHFHKGMTSDELTSTGREISNALKLFHQAWLALADKNDITTDVAKIGNNLSDLEFWLRDEATDRLYSGDNAWNSLKLKNVFPGPGRSYTAKKKIL